MVRGSRRLAWFQKALPMMEAKTATPRLTPINRSQTSPDQAPIVSSAGTASTRANPPVTTPVSSDQSCGETSGSRPIQRLLPMAKADQDNRAASAQTRPIRI
ncbi:hypothetical protein D3C72_1952770 [compost metagenome]